MPPLGVIVSALLQFFRGIFGKGSTVRKKLRWGSVSITGNFRDNNEDRCLIDPSGRFFLVADGMGGQLAGEKASEMAVELIPRKLELQLDFVSDPQPKVNKAIDNAVSHANGEIMALSELDPDFRNMGTTVVMGVRVGDTLHVAGLGDSRAYLFRQGDLQQLTKDHSLAEALREAGTISDEEAKNHRYRTMLYRYLGCKDGNAAETKPVELQVGDKFVLCSDGASEVLSKETFCQLLSSTNDPQLVSDQIVKAAQAAGSKDNITCVSVFVD